MLDAVDLSHLVVQSRLRPGAVAVDATVGNGHDTVFLARQLGPQGCVHGFDIQGGALALTHRRLGTGEEPVASVLLHLSGHEHAGTVLAQHGISRIEAAMFNLGYLPGGDKTLITHADTTLRALAVLSRLLAPDGIISVVAYVGHAGGLEERDAVRTWAQSLESREWAAWRYTALNRGNERAELMVVERLTHTA